MKHLENDLNRGQLEEANGQSIVTSEFASLLSSFNELATKNLEMLRLGKDSGNELGMDRFGNFVRDLNGLSSGRGPRLDVPPFRIFSESIFLDIKNRQQDSCNGLFFSYYHKLALITGLWYRLYFKGNNTSLKSLSPGQKSYELILYKKILW